MKASKLSVNVFVLMGLVAALTTIPATAQSQWDFAWSAALGLAENGFLVVVAPPAFAGCTSGSTWEWFEGELPNVYLYSLFVPDDLDAPTWTLHWVATPPGRYNASWVADAWIRVFKLHDGDLAWFYNDPCGFYSNSIHPYIAEGLGRLNLHSPDDLLEGPGANSWGWVLQGDLDDHGYCPSEKNPRLFWLQDWVTQSNDLATAQTKASKGPTLTCK